MTWAEEILVMGKPRRLFETRKAREAREAEARMALAEHTKMKNRANYLDPLKNEVIQKGENLRQYAGIMDEKAFQAEGNEIRNKIKEMKEASVTLDAFIESNPDIKKYIASLKD